MQQATRGGTSNRALVLISTSLAVWWLLVFASPAEAYIDPSAGGMLVQLLLAGTAGVAVLGKLFWGRIKSLFGMGDTDQTPSPAEDTKLPNDRV